MSEPRKFAVILARHDVSTMPPTVADVRTFLRSSPYAVTRYWQDTTNDWITFDQFDVFGWYDVALPMPPDGRANTANIAKAAAQAAGQSLDGYDGFVVMLYPGQAVVPGKPAPVGYDGGTSGNTSTVMASDPHMFVAHEMGHVLGFDHTYGIPNTGADYDGDNIPDYSPVYGDPYDIMSAESFGGADPTVDYAATFGVAALPGLPGAWIGGPMPARAMVHFYKPLALEAAGKVRHVYETGDDLIVRLNRAGEGGDGAEVLVYHPANEPANGMGRVYVEYRQPDVHAYGTRWDAGLAGSGDERDRAGLVVHVVRPIPGTDTPAVWYAGRIVLPNPDLDVTVDTPSGSVRVTLSEASALVPAAPWVDVRVNRAQAVYLVLRQSTQETRQVTATEQREIPGWSFAGTFSWEHRDVTSTATFLPVSAGLGHGGSYQDAETISIRWLVGGEPLLSGTGQLRVTPPPVGHEVTIDYAIEPGTHRLTLSNHPPDGPYAVSVVCEAREAGGAGPLTAQSGYQAPASEEGWGADYQRFMDYFYRVTHPYPKVPIGPVHGWNEQRFEWAAQSILQMAGVNAQAAAVMRTMLQESQRVAMPGPN